MPEFAYIAKKKSQPGAAYAVCVDDLRFKKETAEVVAEWITEGAIVERVPIEVAREMLGKYVRQK